MQYDYDKIANRETTNSEKYVSRGELFGNDKVIPMWVADMDIQTPPCVTKAVHQRAEHLVYGYEEVPNSAYEAQISWMKKHHGIELEREWMFYSPSVVATINTAIHAFTEPGDKVVVQTPVYPYFFRCVTQNRRCVLDNPLRCDGDGNYTFDFDDLRSKIDENTRLLLLCSPHNPVGRVWSRKELQTLAAICLEHNIKIVADEIHCDLVYPPHKHTPLASLDEDVANITITTIGPGKTFNVSGLAISTVAVINNAMRSRFHNAHESIHFAQGNVFAHVGFEAAYRNGEKWLEGLLVYLHDNLVALERTLEAHSNKIRMVAPQGTYLAWLNCSSMGLSDKELRCFFVESAGLGLSSGTAFGEEGKGFVRLNFAIPKPVMDRALTQLEQALT